MTLSQLRNRVRALQRKYARELAIYHLRKLDREISDECAVAVADGEELPQPLQVVRWVANTGKLFHTYLNLHLYIERCRREGSIPVPREIVLALLPWADAPRYANLLHWDLPAPNSAY